MDVKNVLGSCSNVGGNTGVGACFNDIGFIRGLIFVPAGMTFTTASIAAFKTALEAGILADDPTQRVYPLQGIVKPTDNSTKPVTESFPTGAIAVVNNGFYDWSFQFLRGGLCLSIAMQKANGSSRAFLLFDDKGKLYGTDAGLGFIKGIIPNLAYTPPFVLNTGTANTVYETRVNFTPEQINVNAAYLDFGQDGGLGYLTSLNGLQDVVILQGAARAAGVLKVQAVTSCGTVDLHKEFAADMADVDGWQVRNKATKKPVVISSVADDPTDLGWTVTVDTANANYTATAGGLEIGFAGPTETFALVEVGFESNFLAQ